MGSYELVVCTGMEEGTTKKKPPEEELYDQSRRLVSLDVFRGLTVALMIFVDAAGGSLPSVNHSPWNGVTLADFVMPFFLFIVGVALAFAYKRVENRGVATRKATLRALKLFMIGLVVQGGYFHGVNKLTYGVDVLYIRLMGVLQRIAIAYLVTALCEIWLRNDEDIESGISLLRKYKMQMLVGVIFSGIYLALLYGLFVPDWKFQIPIEGPQPKTFLVKCGVRGDTGPGCNAVGMIDRKVLGIQHLHRRPVYTRTQQCSINSPDDGLPPPNSPPWCHAPFDPEGLISSVMAIVTCLIGLQFGHVIIHFKVDVYGYRRPTVVIEWMGKHALMIYILLACNFLPVLIQGFYWGDPKNNLLRLVGVRG